MGALRYGTRVEVRIRADGPRIGSPGVIVGIMLEYAAIGSTRLDRYRIQFDDGRVRKINTSFVHEERKESEGGNMSLQALRIVREEFETRRELERGEHDPESDGTVIPHLNALETAIIGRIEKEVIDIPTCRFCAEVESECYGGGFEDGIPAHDFTSGD